MDRRVLDIIYCRDCLYFIDAFFEMDEDECWHPLKSTRILNLNPDGKYIPEDCPLTRLSHYCLCEEAVKYKWKNFVCPIHGGTREDLSKM